jgi:hypothetical protein
MKTQLFLDLQESGSAPVPPKLQEPAPAPSRPTARAVPDDVAVPRPRPAVWQGPGAQHASGDATVQRADVGSMQRAPDTAARGLGVAIESWADRAAQSRPASAAAAPAMPQPRRAVEGKPLPGRPARRDEIPSPPVTAPAAVQPETSPQPYVDAGPAARTEPFTDDVTIPRSPSAVDDADWLAARPRAETPPGAAPPRNRFWKRRLVAWSIAGGLLAGLAAGGLWLYEENRVDGALGVVAATSPARTAPAAAPAPQAVAPAPSPPVQPTATTDTVRPLPEVATAAAVPASPAPDDTADRTVKSVDTAAADAADVEPTKRAPRHAETARKRPLQKTPRARTHDTAPAPRVAAEPSARQRREETLLQCRAHGYDERQCDRRACTMTRYGLVCRG